MADQREAVESARAAHGACADGEPCRFVFDSECSLARAVIALDEECRRLRGLLASAIDGVAEGAGACTALACMLDDDDGRSTAASAQWGQAEQRLRKQAKAIQSALDAQPAPSSPGASEPSEVEVEAVARRLVVAYETLGFEGFDALAYFDGLRDDDGADVYDAWLETAREAIRLGARVPR